MAQARSGSNQTTYQHDEEDKPREECGVFGIFDPNEELSAARLTFFALYTLQHRGQEGCGIASCDGKYFYNHKGMGLVTQVFTEDDMKRLKGHSAIGHTRYSTFGSSQLTNAQPFIVETLHGPLAIAHNGQLTATHALRRRLMASGIGMFTSSDSEVIVQMLSAPLEGEKEGEADWVGRIRHFMSYAAGAYALTIMTKDGVFGVRDPHGFRPLCLGKIVFEDVGKIPAFVLASESCALNTIGAEFVRDVFPGEIVCINRHGLHSSYGRLLAPPQKTSLCVFEYVYFSRPDSLLDNGSLLVHQVRQALGRQLAIEQPCVGADLVMGVPDSSTPAAIGYAFQSRIPYNEGLTKNRYIGRTFIHPDQSQREKAMSLKFNPLVANLRGKNIVIIDDSIVRGNTLMFLIRFLRSTNPKSIHVRISSPPVRHPCFMGINMSTYEELIGHKSTVEEICEYIGADSLGYLSLEGMMKVVEEGMSQEQGKMPPGHCNACFSGAYPLEIEDLIEMQKQQQQQGSKATNQDEVDKETGEGVQGKEQILEPNQKHNTEEDSEHSPKVADAKIKIEFEGEPTTVEDRKSVV